MIPSTVHRRARLTGIFAAQVAVAAPAGNSKLEVTALRLDCSAGLASSDPT